MRTSCALRHRSRRAAAAEINADLETQVLIRSTLVITQLHSLSYKQPERMGVGEPHRVQCFQARRSGVGIHFSRVQHFVNRPRNNDTDEATLVMQRLPIRIANAR